MSKIAHLRYESSERLGNISKITQLRYGSTERLGNLPKFSSSSGSIERSGNLPKINNSHMDEHRGSATYLRLQSSKGNHRDVRQLD